MENFHQIMPLSTSGNEVAGYINVLGEEFYIHLKVQDTAAPRKVLLRGCEKVNEILKPILDNLKQHLHQSGTVNDMLHEIQNAIEQQIRSKGMSYSMEPHSEYNALLEQLHTCGWDKVRYISPDFHVVHLKYVDESDREHILKIGIPEKVK
ncbi:uncharacterized protein LOC118187868, partial [Stegodyphus dumicola]|uniref:uncharacterized protein LOC118187868 n=1 Tax=Stegodyphus dumicola TaxID=202533 RepID=UPI0015AE4061